MFRKPKKKPVALRGSTSNNGNGNRGLDDNVNDSASKKRRRPRKNSSSSSEGNSDHEDGEGTSDLLQQIRQEQDASKTSKKSTSVLLNTSSTTNKKSKDWMQQYKSNNNQMSAKDMATRSAEYHPTESSKKSKSNDGAENSAVDANAKISSLQSNQPANKFHAGPLRAATFVRTTARFDYQPDICKDYKETGFCGFGDTCIYLHDRGDTKTGWQMEQEYEEKKKRDEERRGREVEKFMNSMKEGASDAVACDDEDDVNVVGKDDDGLPFACHICRGPFHNPIVTTCGHYFCERCMLQRIREGNAGCPVCQKDTHGVLNFPQKLVGKKRRLVGRDGTWEEYLAKIGGNCDEE
mmetsp:Transcript_10423/g.20681  ORF Transcript_10423/g.20681 Transcript_10423/m.20681 type:complete len:351 (+) Transcript_10423:210-1262(+)